GDAVAAGGAIDDHRVAGRRWAAVDVDREVHGRICQVDDDHVIVAFRVDVESRGSDAGDCSGDMVIARAGVDGVQCPAGRALYAEGVAAGSQADVQRFQARVGDAIAPHDQPGDLG